MKKYYLTAGLIVLSLSSPLFASESVTVNSSDAYVTGAGDTFVNEYVPFLTDYEVSTGTRACELGDCTAHGQDAVDAWAATGANNYFSATTTEAIDVDNPNVIGTENRTKFVPRYFAYPNDLYMTNDALSQEIFGVGKGLPINWLNELRESSGLDTDFCGGAYDSLTSRGRTGVGTYNNITMTDSDACIDSEFEDNTRTEFIDQIVMGYIATGDNFAQNFRDQMTFGSTRDWMTGEILREDGDGSIIAEDDCATDGPAECFTFLDARIEQGDTDMENINQNAQIDGNGTLSGTQVHGDQRLISAFQQVTSVKSNPTSPDGFVELPICDNGEMYPNGGCLEKWMANVEQNMNGYFYACINCNVNDEHSFSAPLKPVMQSWLSENPEITSIVHRSPATQTSRAN